MRDEIDPNTIARVAEALSAIDRTAIHGFTAISMTEPQCSPPRRSLSANPMRRQDPWLTSEK
jgi:hypothetical protein